MTAVATLAGAELALWVARAQKLEASIGNDGLCYLVPYGPMAPAYAPHEDWAQGGLLIDKYLIEVERPRKGEHVGQWSAWMDGDNACGYGETALIAAMRALVASVYGAKVPV